MKLEHKILLPNLFLLVILLGTSAYTFLNSIQENEILEDYQDRVRKANEISLRLSQLQKESTVGLFLYQLTLDESYRDIVLKDEIESVRLTDQLGSIAISEFSKELLGEYAESKNRISVIQEEILDSIIKGGDTRGLLLQWDIYNEKLEASLEDLTGSIIRDSEKELSKIKDSKRKFNLVVMFLVCFSLGMVIVSFFIYRYRLTKPMRELYKSATDIRKGNFKTRTNIKSADELEELSNALNDAGYGLSLVGEKNKQIEKSKTEFLSITSHELRSPMTPMKAQLQMLLQGYFGKLNKKQEGSLNIILRNTQRLDRILGDFLEISRIEAARLKFNFIKTSLNDYIDQVISAESPIAERKNIKIETHVDKLPVIEVDPDRIMQVLRNLLDNAIKFSPDGGTIVVRGRKIGRKIEISVKDEGIGILEKNKNKIFEPFFQEENSMYRKYQGTGLGLAICRGIIHSQNGKIWLDSKKGKGSTFTFTIPLVPVKETKPIKLLFSKNKRSIEGS